VSGGREARAAFLAEAAAGAPAEREPDPVEAAERAAVAPETAGDVGVPLAPVGHRAALAGLLGGAPTRPPAWADPASVPPPGAWCTCCGRHHRRGGRWWCEAGERPRGWRCWTCYPPDHLPAEAVREVRT
jgi:hypothetical protein